MRHIVILSAALLFAPVSMAAAAGLSGSSALALAALVGKHSRAVSHADKRLLKAYLAGKADAHHEHGKTIEVTADSVTCRASNVDITSHSCDLTFGTKKKSLHGRKAHELFATLIENGIQAEGAAGSMIAGISKLDCTIKADEVAEEGGGGATCTYETQ